MDNPFAKVAEQSRDVARDLAVAVKVAHSEGDVWAVCRALDNLRGQAGGWHASFLHGSRFWSFVDDHGDITDLSGLRELAHEYWDGTNG